MRPRLITAENVDLPEADAHVVRASMRPRLITAENSGVTALNDRLNTMLQ